jgi:hypothetical protein
MVNTYRRRFNGRCPTNGEVITYDLTIEIDAMVQVERIVAATTSLHGKYHEAIADELLALFGGKQTLQAWHHGVHIETVREAGQDLRVRHA